MSFAIVVVFIILKKTVGKVVKGSGKFIFIFRMRDNAISENSSSELSHSKDFRSDLQNDLQNVFVQSRRCTVGRMW